jgi:hypothetical protein
MQQLVALIADTYRSLKCRGLYWVIFWISIVLGVVYASLGCTANGWSIFFGLYEFPSSFLREGTEWEKSLLLTTLNGLMDYWMMTFAVVLALFPTTTIFPDTMKPGAIDFMLSKPISRFKLFVGKYLGAMMFVVVQAALLTGICFVSVFFRLGILYWEIFWCVGLTTLIFSFIYSLNVFVGVVTRSGVAALLWTALFWFIIWLTQKIEFETGHQFFRQMQVQVQANQGDLQSITGAVQKTHQFTGTVMNYLPRTRQTGDLFRRIIEEKAPHSFEEIMLGGKLPPIFNQLRPPPEPPVWKVIGPGLIFQAVLLLLAFWHFATRDF